MADSTTLFVGDTKYGHYVVADTAYAGRPARVLYSGNHQAAQSGVARDDNSEMLFDYNERFRELVHGLRPKRLLLIGGGAFTLPVTLQRESPELRQDIVELDGKLYDLARQYFDFSPSKHTTVYIDEGGAYLDKTTERYDLILIDAFTHDVVPESFQSEAFVHSLRRVLHPSGIIAMNLISAYYGQRAGVLLRQTACFRRAFSSLLLFPAGNQTSLWIPQNFVLTAQNGNQDLTPYLRYESLSVPSTDTPQS